MNSFDNDPRFNNLSPLKRKIILELAGGSESKSMEQLLPEIMQINRELQKRNLSFTKEETDLIIDIMLDFASPADKQKIAMLRSMM